MEIISKYILRIAVSITIKISNDKSHFISYILCSATPTNVQRVHKIQKEFLFLQLTTRLRTFISLQIFKKTATSYSISILSIRECKQSSKHEIKWISYNMLVIFTYEIKYSNWLWQLFVKQLYQELYNHPNRSPD